MPHSIRCSSVNSLVLLGCYEFWPIALWLTALWGPSHLHFLPWHLQQLCRSSNSKALYYLFVANIAMAAKFFMHCSGFEPIPKPKTISSFGADRSDQDLLISSVFVGNHQALTNPPQLEVAGQRAPINFDYLHDLVESTLNMHLVLFFSCCNDDADMRHNFFEYLDYHQLTLLEPIAHATSLIPTP